MSLSWDISNCKNHESIKTESEWYKTETLIFATMAVDMHEITEANFAEFYARIKVVSFLQEGMWYTAGFGYEHPTLEDVQKRIGLHTNAYSKNTLNKWFTRMTVCYKEASKDQMWAIYYNAKVEVASLTTKEMVGA